VLAEALSVAAQVEPSLIRAVRLSLFPDLDTQAEADLWFSPLISRRGADGVAVDDAALDTLHAGLLTRPWAAAAFDLVATHHAGAARTVRLEESLLRTALTAGAGAADRLEEQWQSVLDAMVRDATAARNLGRWVLRADKK